MTIDTPTKVQRAIRIGSVSYLNAKPLVYGLHEADDLRLHLDVPSQLLDGLRERRYDVALAPVIDYQRLPGLRLLTAGAIGADGDVMTVCIFSRVPIQQITTLHCDIDSHTSVALARIILAEQYGLRPAFVDYKLQPADAATPEAMLLIGDKVVCETPRGYEHRLDMGRAWKDLTGLPFVYGAWLARDGVDLRDLPQRLAEAWQLGLRKVEQIIQEFALPRGWPAAQAKAYLTQYMKYDVGPRQLEAIRRFHALAAKHGMIPDNPRPLEIVG